DHAYTGTPLPWKKALVMPGAEQMAHVIEFFNSIDFWKLRPVPSGVVNNPGTQTPAKFIAAAKSDDRELMVVYVPEDRTVEVKLDSMPTSPSVTWVHPRGGEKRPAVAVVTTSTCQFPTPTEGDWILFMKLDKKDASAAK